MQQVSPEKLSWNGLNIVGFQYYHQNKDRVSSHFVELLEHRNWYNFGYYDQTPSCMFWSLHQLDWYWYSSWHRHLSSLVCTSYRKHSALKFDIASKLPVKAAKRVRRINFLPNFINKNNEIDSMQYSLYKFWSFYALYAWRKRML